MKKTIYLENNSNNLQELLKETFYEKGYKDINVSEINTENIYDIISNIYYSLLELIEKYGEQLEKVGLNELYSNGNYEDFYKVFFLKNIGFLKGKIEKGSFISNSLNNSIEGNKILLFDDKKLIGLYNENDLFYEKSNEPPFFISRINEIIMR